MSKLLSLTPLFLFSALASAATNNHHGHHGCDDKFNADCYASGNVITRDVAIIGGGSSGTFAAITLKDLGKSIVVVEKAAQLGGHVETYTDPTTGQTVDYGVQVFWNTSVVTDFFARVKAPVKAFSPPSVRPTTIYADFSTGENVTDFTPSSDWSAYKTELAKYPYFNRGFELPTPVPEDLALPFGEFVKKYDLQDIAYSAWVAPAVGGFGTILDVPTAYIFKAQGDVTFSESSPGAALVSATNNNHQAFANAQTELASNILLSSTVSAASRPAAGANGPVKLVVNTPSGTKLVIASKVLFTAGQTTSNLAPLALDSTETAVFSQLKQTGFFSGLISNTGLPATISYQNAGPSADTFHIPEGTSNVMHLSPTALTGVHSFWYQSDSPVSADTAKQAVQAAVAQFAGESNGAATKFVAFGDHTPGGLYAPQEATANGFWAKLNALQGYRGVWYTGLLFEPASGPLWVFTKDLITDMFA
ncbi:uncharacterized protein C8A04DRAFT_40062 [Dichotomopilus funicola]|uniref:FAD dependent oxidoreductase n=1 Tax=Dichotomopilus funicola TaxID=1934379 RepID=A0AAN6ZJM2_9PEZI|nr:hypothetical protein C8A04DRAFT_40062 [Dichotomopilus funicola]